MSCRIIFKEFKILTITLFCIFEVLCYTTKNKIYETQSLKIHNYNTRGKEDLYVQPWNTSHCKKCSVNIEIKLYNKLAVGIIRIKSFKDFRSILRTFPLDNSFYSTQELFFFGKTTVRFVMQHELYYHIVCQLLKN